MKFLSKVADFVGGSLFKEVKDAVMSYFPPDMTPQEKAEAELKLQDFLHRKQVETNAILTEAAAQLDKRISEQEGTAKDLLALPVVGRLMLFFRGVQRPVWSFATLYMDYLWFFGSVTMTEQQEMALTIINLLVLGFLFGERAVKNLEPIILKVFDRYVVKG